MPIDPAVASTFHLIDGVTSFQEFLEDPALADRREAFFAHPGYDVPAVAVRADEAPGPHGPVPVRVYARDPAAEAPCLVWLHGGGFIGGDLDMPQADWVRGNWPAGPGSSCQRRLPVMRERGDVPGAVRPPWRCWKACARSCS
jgi:hypothetical protein